MSDFETVQELVATGRERDGVALRIAGRRTPYSYADFCTNCWKAANLLDQYGGHPGGRIDVIVGPKPDEPEPFEQLVRGQFTSADPLQAILGGTLLGATVAVNPGTIDARVLVTPAGWQTSFDLPAGCSVLAYGGPPTAPQVAHFESERWSQNPIEPPEQIEADMLAVRFGDDTWTHGQLLEGVASVQDTVQLDASNTVGLVAPIRDPASLVAGILAPLAVGATVSVAPSIEEFDEESDLTCVFAPPAIEAESTDLTVPVYDVKSLVTL